MTKMNYNENCFFELTIEEAKFVNGGEPTKHTSFWYDSFYELSHTVGKIYKAAVEEGIFSRSWWEDFSIDLSS